MRDIADDFNPEWHADLIVGHPFQGTGQWGDVCEHESGGWICGYSRAEHADQGKEAPNVH
jgi:hypothetical protein